MENKFIITLIIGFGVLQYSKNQNTFVKVVFGGQLLALFFRFFDNLEFHVFSFYTMFGMALLMLTYSIWNKQYTKQKRGVLMVILLPFLIQNFYAFQHYPYQSQIAVLLVIPVISWMYIVLAKRSEYKVELPVVSIFASLALLQTVSFYF